MSAEKSNVVEESFHQLKSLLQELRVPLSASKLTPPTTNMVCLGIQIDSEKETLAIPFEKISQIIQKCRETLKMRNISKKGLQSLLGLLLFLHKAVKPARIFVNRLLQTLRENFQKKFIQVDENMKKDLRWFLRFCQSYNGKTKYVHPPLSVYEKVALDACLTGLGGVYNDNYVQL